MELVKKLASGRKEKSEKFKQMEEDYRLQKMLEDRQKSSNERELEKRMKQAREEQIKAQLDILRKEDQKKAWKSNDILKGGKSILKDDMSILKDNKKLGIGIGKGNMFMDNKNKVPLQNKRQGMFFRW